MFTKTEIFYDIYNDHDEKVVNSSKVILCFSARACDHQAWKFFFVPFFVRVGFTVVVFDYRGTGKSVKSVNEGEGYSLKMFADDGYSVINDFFNHDHDATACATVTVPTSEASPHANANANECKLEDKKVIVVGHSMGGIVAQIFALDYPHLVSNLILLSPNSGEATKPYEGIPIPMVKSIVTDGYENFIRSSTVKTGWTRSFVEQNPDLIEKILQSRMTGFAPLENFLHHVVALQSHDHTHRYKDLHTPTIIFVGDAETIGAVDRSHVAMATKLSKSLPNVKKIITLKDEGHHYIATRGQQTCEEIYSFLIGTSKY